MLDASGLNPDDYMALWVHPVPDERGISIGATHEGITFVQMLAAMPSAALVNTSRLLVTTASTVSLDVRAFGVRLVIARKTCEVPPVPDDGWEVVLAAGVDLDDIDSKLPRHVADRFGWNSGGATYSVATVTLYEAQAVYNLLTAAGINASMRPLPKPEEPASRDLPVAGAGEAVPQLVSAEDEDFRARLLSTLGGPPPESPETPGE